MIAIIQHFIPDINFELEGLKAAGEKLGIPAPAPSPAGQTPRRSLPPSLEAANLQRSESTPGQSEVMSERSRSRGPSDFAEEEEGEEEGEDATVADELLTIAEPSLDVQPPILSPLAPPTSPVAPRGRLREIAPLTSTSPLPRPPPPLTPATSSAAELVSIPGPTTQPPSRQSADIFVERYFTDVNDVFCLLSYDSFMTWYRPSYPNQPLDLARQVILYTVFAFGSRDDINGSADIYFSYALGAIGPLLGQGGFETVQALTLMVYPSSS